jgi:hypothetical protein
MSLLDTLTLKPEQDNLKRVIDGKVYWHHSLLSNWEKNEELRILKEKDWLRLLKSIKKHGIKDDFQIGLSGTVYDGNHRLKALNDLIAEGITKSESNRDLEWVPVSINNPQNEVEELALAMRGNDNDFAVWNKDAIANQKELFEQVPDFEDYSFSFDDPVTFGDVFETYDESFTEEEVKPVKEPKEITCPECSAKFVVK